MKTKIFTITKTGYNAGIYGCSAEYFICIYTKISNYQGKKELTMERFTFEGMYWVEERIKESMGKKGFNYYYTWSNYWKLSKKDVNNNTMREYESIKYIENWFKN